MHHLASPLWAMTMVPVFLIIVLFETFARAFGAAALSKPVLHNHFHWYRSRLHDATKGKYMKRWKWAYQEAASMGGVLNVSDVRKLHKVHHNDHFKALFDEEAKLVDFDEDVEEFMKYIGKNASNHAWTSFDDFATDMDRYVKKQHKRRNRYFSIIFDDFYKNMAAPSHKGDSMEDAHPLGPMPQRGVEEPAEWGHEDWERAPENLPDNPRVIPYNRDGL